MKGVEQAGAGSGICKGSALTNDSALRANYVCGKEIITLVHLRKILSAESGQRKPFCYDLPRNPIRVINRSCKE